MSLSGKKHNHSWIMSETVRAMYARNQDDESMDPVILCNENGDPEGRISHNDSVIFYDIRGEREIQLTDSLTNPDFSHFPIRKNLDLDFTTMIEYDPGLGVRVAFPPVGEIRDTLCEVLSREGLMQAKIVETEKSVHMSYFLNGKRKEPFPGEDLFFISSLHNVENYDEHPHMRIGEVTEKVMEVVRAKRHDVVFCNFANVDVIGHIENARAVMKAVNSVDTSLGKVIHVAETEQYHIIITADHGTVEKWKYPDGAVDTGHTDSPVPFIYIQPGTGNVPGHELRAEGSLIDVAPTVLDILRIQKPESMTGQSLFQDSFSGPAGNFKQRVLIIILDGWGTGAQTDDNLIFKSRTPVMDRISGRYPCALLKASGEIVGMPANSVGNSEAGHLHIGAGRTVLADRQRIDRALEDGSFHANREFLKSIEHTLQNDSTLHLLGIVSFYSSHGSLDHLFALMELANRKNAGKVMIHALLGRRGEHPESGARYIRRVEEKCLELGTGKVATVMGRFWALDREYNWDRIEKAYRALVFGEGIKTGQ